MKTFKSGKAISPVLAVLLLVAIAVGASIVAYTWISDFVSQETQKAGVFPTMDRVVFQKARVGSVGPEKNIVVFTIRNIGDAQGYLDIVYWGNEPGKYVNATKEILVYNNILKVWINPLVPVPIEPGKAVNIAIEINWISGETYYFKIVLTNGVAIEVSDVSPTG